ncbi:MAG: hypothetical protein WCQ99_16650 [Pseudomonadota bacterium]
MSGNQFLCPQEVQALTGYTKDYLANQRLFKRGIKFYKMGRLIRYKKEDVIKYMTRFPVETEDFKPVLLKRIVTK